MYRSVLALVTGLAFLATPAVAQKKNEKKGTTYSCAKVGETVKKYLQDEINDALGHLKFKYTKELVGQKGWVKVTPPRVVIGTEINAKKNRITFKPRLEKGSVSAGVELDLIFKKQKISDSKPFPEKDIKLKDIVYWCPVDSCGMLDDGTGKWADIATIVLNAFLNQIREANKKIRIGKVTIEADWPNLVIDKTGENLTLALTAWRIESIKYQSYEFKVPKKWEVPKASVTFRCPFAPIKKEKKKKPPVQECDKEKDKDCDGVIDNEGTPGDRVNLYVEFEFNSTKLTGAAKSTLRSSGAKKSFDNPPAGRRGARVDVIGHADCIPGKDGTQKVNEWFSTERAKEVAEFLKGRYDGWRFRSDGKSSTVRHCTPGDEGCTVCSCKGRDADSEGCQSDRRVEINFAD